MVIKDSFKLKNFETYCITVIEIDKIQRLKLGAIAENRILFVLDTIRTKIEEEISSEIDLNLQNAMRAILETHLTNYETFMREHFISNM